jgi:hypothetical protein
VQHITADIILLDSGTKFGRAILWFIRLLQKDPIKFCHCILSVGGGYGIQADKKVSYCVVDDECEKAKSFKVIRNKNLSYEQRNKVVDKMKVLLGLPYSVRVIVLQALDKIFGTTFFTRTFGNKDCHVCSSAIAWAYYAACGIKFDGVGWKTCDPDNIDDESLNNTEDWETIEER